jgi:hypothetical protein
MDSAIPPSMMNKTFTTSHTQVPLSVSATAPVNTSPAQESQLQLPVAPIPITISPATPTLDPVNDTSSHLDEVLSEKNGSSNEKEKTKLGGLRVKRSISMDRGDITKNKKVQQVQQMLKARVHKSRAGITAVSRKIGHGVSKHHQLHLRRTNSSPSTL